MSNNDPQKNLNLPDDAPLDSVEQYRFEREPIKGQPELRWTGKRPFTSTQYYPAQLRETYGQSVDGWLNRIYWGDNLQVMSHLLKEFRGKVQLVYIDPPFDSKAEYKKKVELKNLIIESDLTTFEEKQYSDIWTNDEYLQFIYERLILAKELMREDGAIYFHCDARKSAHIKLLLNEVFLDENFRNEIIWHYKFRMMDSQQQFNRKHDNIWFYAKSGLTRINMPKEEWTREELIKNRKQEIMVDEEGREWIWMPGAKGNSKSRKIPIEEIIARGKAIDDVWDMPIISSSAHERTGYPTQKPESLIERIILASSKPGDIVFDFFMGSGTTQAVAMKLGRRFLGADINLGAVEITSRRLISVAAELNTAQRQQKLDAEWQNEDGETRPIHYYSGFSVYNVNHYDVFRNPVEARGLLLEALEIQPYPPGHVFDGEKDGQQVKLMPVNRIATRADLNDLIANLDYKTLERRHADAPNQPTERILLVCMGHEPDLAAQLQQQVPFKLATRVYDVLRDGQHLTFKRPAEAHLTLDHGELVIDRFYPMNLLQKLSLLEENVDDWRQLVETVKVDWQHNGQVFAPALIDAAEGETLVKGRYPVPPDAALIKVKITDLLSESWEGEISASG